MSNPNQPSFESVNDIVDVNEQGRGQRPNGDAMSNFEMKQVVAHQDQIREGIAELHDGTEAAENVDNTEVAETNSVDEAAKTAAIQAAEQKKLQEAKDTALDALNELIDQGVTLDGPTLNKAGLGYMDRMKLGYVGSMDGMLADAEARRNTEEKQRVIAARRAVAEQHAAEWTKEKDAWREEREATDLRISNLMDGSAAVEGLSYKEKLEQGGELGLKFKVEHSKLDQDEATAQASAEGLSTEHLKPRYHEVVTNPAAEQRAAEMAQLLKDMRPKASEVANSKQGAVSHQEAVRNLNNLSDVWSLNRKPEDGADKAAVDPSADDPFAAQWAEQRARNDYYHRNAGTFLQKSWYKMTAGRRYRNSLESGDGSSDTDQSSRSLKRDVADLFRESGKNAARNLKKLFSRGEGNTDRAPKQSKKTAEERQQDDPVTIFESKSPEDQLAEIVATPTDQEVKKDGKVVKKYPIGADAKWAVDHGFIRKEDAANYKTEKWSEAAEKREAQRQKDARDRLDQTGTGVEEDEWADRRFDYADSPKGVPAAEIRQGLTETEARAIAAREEEEREKANA